MEHWANANGGVYVCVCAVRDPCLEGNGGCAQLCSSANGIPECSCRPGHTLASDGLACDGKHKQSA